MEKEHQTDSMATIPIKPDYAPSEVYSSEPPPAYHNPKTASVQIAKIVSVTIILVAMILGGCILASAYITANASCKQLEQELQLLTETADRMQPLPPLQPEALIQEEPHSKQTSEPLKSVNSPKIKEIDDNNVHEEKESSNSNSDFSSDEDESEEAEQITPIHIKLPLHIDMDDIAGAIIDKNQRSKMNCIVEKKRAEEVVDHKPKTVNLPFGVNITTDPRYERVTGERMVIICESGSMHRNIQPQMKQPQPQPSDDQEETVMVQPIVIPIGPINPYQTHMPQQIRPQMQNPMEAMRPPMLPMMQQQMQQQQQNHPNLPNPIIQNIVQQLIAQRIRMEMQRAAQEEASQQREAAETREVPMPRQIPIPEEVLRQINRLPTNEVVISVSEQEPEEAPQEMRIVQQPRQSAQEMNGRQTYARGLPVHIPVPMMQQQAEPQEQEPQQSASGVIEELRPHLWFRLAQAEGKQYSHKHSLPPAVMEAIKPTFKALAEPSLLKKCLHGKTQNVNESFNNVIWSRVPKNNFVGRDTLEVGVFDSVITFNDGNIGRINVLKVLGFSDCGLHTVAALKAADESRVRKAERAALEATKEARVQRRRKRLALEERGEADYNPGAF